MERVGVVGGGIMGAGIAEVAACAGLDVVLVESGAGAARSAEERIDRSLARLGREDVRRRIDVVADLDVLADRDVVVEAIVEDEAAKASLFRRLDEVVIAPDAVLATNTSSIPVTRIAAVTKRPERVVGIHFVNPVPVMRLVELVPSYLTSEGTLARSRTWVEQTLGRTVIVSRDRAGFVLNAMLVPFVLSAIRMLESGFATAEDIDHALVLGAGHPRGPLALADLIGLDTTKAVAESLYAEFKEPTYAAPPLLARMVEAGHLGRKTGRGFYDYDLTGAPAGR